MGIGLCPSPHHGYPCVVAAVCLVCPGRAGGGEFGGSIVVVRRAGRGGPAAAGRLTSARAVGLEYRECNGALAPRGQELVYSSLIPHSIQLGGTVSICVLTSALSLQLLQLRLVISEPFPVHFDIV